MSPWWFDKLKRFDAVLNDNVTFSFVGGVFVWLVVVIGLELWVVLRLKISSKVRFPRSRHEQRRLGRGTDQHVKRTGATSQSRKSK
jgi:hypothetical protein